MRNLNLTLLFPCAYLRTVGISVRNNEYKSFYKTADMWIY